MHTSWIGVMLGFLLMLLVLSNIVYGKAFLENAPYEGNQNYYSDIRNPYQPIYDQSYAANPKLFYTPQLDGQPIYIPAISGSEHVNKFLDDYYKINRDYTQSWTLAPPVTYDYDITSESSYYENGAAANSMVKNLLEEKYKDGAYSSYMLPATPKNLPKQEKTTDHKKGIEHKDPGNKKTHNRKKKRPHGVSTEHSYFTPYKTKTEIPEDSSTILIKSDYNKQEDKSPVLAKSDISEVDDYDEMDRISTFELKEDKTKNDKKQIKSEIDYSKGVKKDKKPNKKDKNRQPVKHKNKSKTEPVNKSYVEDYMTNSPNLKHSIKEKTTETSKYSTNKIKNKVSVGKNKPEVDALNELSDVDYEPEIVDVINEDDYEPEIVDVINELSDNDYDPEVVNELSNNDYQQDVDVIKIPHFETDTEDSDESNNPFSSKKDENTKTKISSAYSKVENEKPKKGKHKSVKVSNKPNKHLVKDEKYSTSDMNLYKPGKKSQSPKDNSKETKKMPVDSYKQYVVDEINKLSHDDLDGDVAELSDIDDLDTEDIINEENIETSKPEKQFGNDETVLDTFTSEKEKAKPSKPEKAKPSKPEKAKPSKPEKAKDHYKNIDKYNESGIKSTNPKEIHPPKIETKDESKKYESGHIMKGKDKDALIADSIIENQTEDYDPEAVDGVNKLSDNLETEVEDVAELSDIDLDPEIDVINEENNFDTEPETHLLSDETVIDTFTSKNYKAKPSKPVKAKPSKPEKTKDHDKNIEKYDGESVIKSTNLKETQTPKIETKDESKQEYESDGHMMKGKDEDALVDESIIGNQIDKEINSRDLLNQPTDIPNEVEEFDGSGSQAVDTSMRRIPQFFKNVESIRNLTSMNSNIWSLIFNPNAERNEPKRCVTRSNETGICMYVQQCEVPNIATSLEQLLNNACVMDDMFIGVCCPEFPVQTVKVHWDEMPSNSDKQSEDEFGHNADGELIKFWLAGYEQSLSNLLNSFSLADCGMRTEDAKKTESWPWQAPLVSMSNGKIFCGGVIINDDYILTAAHCTTKIPKNQILVRLGQHDATSGDDFAVVEIKRHAQYNPRNMHNDIALLKLGKRIVRDKHTDAVCLPEEDDDDDHEDEKAVLLGIKGKFSQSSKPTEWLKVMSNNDCEKKLGSKVPATLLCTDARDENERTCNLDSGAALVVEDDDRYEVIGILSWNRNDCDERFPSTFSRVSKYVRWIKKHAV